MPDKMFCFQCEQTAKGCGCNISGVCGKTPEVANLQDKLTGCLIGLTRAADNNPDVNSATYNLIIKSLFTTITNVCFDKQRLNSLINKVNNEKSRLVPDCDSCSSPCGRTDNYDMNKIWNADEDIRSLKSLILFGLRGMAAYAYHANVLGHSDEDINKFFLKAVFTLGEDLSTSELLDVVLECGKYNLKCMEMLNNANTKTYGTPTPTKVPLTIEKGPFIVVSGHDFHDLDLLLKQTEGSGVNIYTHGEMIPAHAYPNLKKYKHLKGNFGTAWQNQKKEFDNIPAPILFTTNCLMPPLDSYKDRVFTTAVVAYPEVKHIGQDKNFSEVIAKARSLGGYLTNTEGLGINGGNCITTGFGKDAILENADKIINLIKEGKIKHIFLVAGCDGARKSRQYYTDFVKLTPKDTLILTLACGKYRFNDIDLSDIEGIPRILDVGQCNDAYSAIQVASALADAFKCDINDLPLSFVLSWYEQKAVAVLLTLLSLGIKNIHLGPTLPAFVSKNVLDVLVEKYNITPISTPEEDLERFLAKA